jgi:hypothetical protein
MALIVLTLLLALMVAFAALSRSEPVIANNHLRGAQARSLAESGIERALWALTNPAERAGLPEPLPEPVPPPYDGATLVGLASGGFFVAVRRGAVANEREVVAVGWTPTWSPDDPRPRAHARVAATLTRLRDIARDAPCALCLRGDAALGGAVTIDGRPGTGTSCGDKLGVWATGRVELEGRARVYGADGNDVGNQPTDYTAAGSESAFAAFGLTSAELDQLRALARRGGTYLRGAVSLDAVPNGLVFVDTPSGTNPTHASPPGDLARVTIGPGAFADPAGFRGWIVVNGDIDVGGNFGGIHGMVYAVGDVTTTGTGTSGLVGLMIVQRVRETASRSTGNLDLRFDCAAARGAGQLPTGWYVKDGTYRELSD